MFDILLIQSFTQPPPAVRTVLEAVCVMFGEKEGWDNAKKLLSKTDFMDMIKSFDRDNIPEARLKKLRKTYLTQDNMNPEVMGDAEPTGNKASSPGCYVQVVSKVSKAATGLCLWCRAMDVYAEVATEVEPKKVKLTELNAELEAAHVVLKSKQVTSALRTEQQQNR
jgi:dynein heavy chain